MIKSLIIFFIALAVGVGAVAIVQSQGGNSYSDSYSQSANSNQRSAIPVKSSMIRNFGPKETVTRVEYCEGRCRCDRYNVTETVAKAGIIRANKTYDVGANPVPRCPGINGTHNRAPVPGASGQCYVCPSGMSLSAFSRGGDDLLRRWNYSEPACVKVVKECAN